MTVPLLPLYSIFSFSSCFIHLTFSSLLCMYVCIQAYIELIVITCTSPPGSYRISIIQGARFKCIPLLKGKLLRAVLCVVHCLISTIGYLLSILESFLLQHEVTYFHFSVGAEYGSSVDLYVTTRIYKPTPSSFNVYEFGRLRNTYSWSTKSQHFCDENMFQMIFSK